MKGAGRRCGCRMAERLLDRWLSCQRLPSLIPAAAPCFDKLARMFICKSRPDLRAVLRAAQLVEGGPAPLFGAGQQAQSKINGWLSGCDLCCASDGAGLRRGTEEVHAACSSSAASNSKWSSEWGPQ